MNSALIGELLSGINLLLPLVPGGAAVAPILNILEKVIPVAVQEYQDVKPIIKDIIATLKADPATTADQIDRLTALDAKVDADFDAAAAAAEAEDGP